MRTLYLSGHGISMRVDHSHLLIRDGCEFERPEPMTYELKPKHDEFDNIVIYGHSGNITLEAIKWLSRHNIQLTILNWDGSLVASVTIPEPKQGANRFAQYRAFIGKNRVEIGKRFIDAKIRTSVAVLDWVAQRHPDVRETKKGCFEELDEFKDRLPEADTIAKVRGIEGMVARNYWLILAETFDKRLEFEGRAFGKTGRPMAAVDPINCLFNYGYSLLESHCIRAINANGLDPYIGFVHEMAPGKSPLAYDLQEPFRWMVDIAVIRSLEQNIFTKKDFVRTDNYVVRLRSEGAQKLVEAVHKQFTTKVKFRGKSWEWGNVITQKTAEFVDYLQGRKDDLDFANPIPVLVRDDSAELRRKILAMSYADWKAMGFSKGTLHYLKANARKDEPFKVYDKVREKLEAL